MRTKIARVASKHIKKASKNLSLHVYDFDKTLFKSPEPPSWWNTKKHGHWWTSADSLGRPFIPDHPQSSRYWIPETVRNAKNSISDHDVWAVLCTGREDRGGVRYRIAEILKAQSLDFDEVYLRPSSSSEVVRYKVKTLLALLKKYNIKSVYLWEDEEKNINAFRIVCQKLNIPFFGNLINTNIQDNNISEEEYYKLKSEWG